MDISDWTFCLRSFDLDDSEWGATVNEIPLTVADIGHSDKLVVFSFPPKVAALRARVAELEDALLEIDKWQTGENNIEDDEDWEADEVLRRRVRVIVKQALAGRKEG
jgi:hypothetical protein